MYNEKKMYNDNQNVGDTLAELEGAVSFAYPRN
jgi:hypothetical protein